MHPYPRLYRVTASGGAAGDVTTGASDLPDLAIAPPPEFDGPGGRWSPETLLCAAVADCFVLSFRAVAKASRFEWTSLACAVEGTLERVDGVTRFTRFVNRARLEVPAGTDPARAQTLLEKAEKVCLVTSSLTATTELVVEVVAA
jgi:organic hydroperoxide reductase OsmC/OhrA